MIARTFRWLAGPVLRRIHARRDRQVLAYLSRRYNAKSARSVADALGWPVRRASVSLGRLRAAGRVSSTAVDGTDRFRVSGGGR